MGSPVLDASPLAGLLLDLAARKASGRLSAGGRALALRAGDLIDILPAAEDESLERFLVESGRIAGDVIAEYEHGARGGGRGSIPDALVADGVLTASELRQVRRAILLDRLTRTLRTAAERAEPLPALAAEGAGASASSVALLPLVLDALARCAAVQDAAVVGAHLNHRIDWLENVHMPTARAWADLGDAPQRPAVSTVLAKRPAAAPRIAALLRAGLVRLDPPGRAVPSQPPDPASLPPPPPRSVTLDEPAPLAASERDPLAAVKPPRVRLDPGQAQVDADPLEATALPELAPPGDTPYDALLPLEQRIADLEARGAPGAERARAFCALADVWRDRFGSLERACRAFREAASADPTVPGVLQQAALHCHHLGQRDLALRYVEAAVASAVIPVERAGAQRLRAAIARSAGDVETCIEALCEAAADDPTTADSHEQVAALLLERGQVDGANAHARLAATAVQDETPERALALLALSWTLKPEDAATAYEYASLLDVTGRRAVAVAVLAHTASRAEDPDQRRKLRLAGAERAEAAGRADLAAELLVDAFDSEPHFDLLYGPLDEDLAAVELAEYRAAVLEDIATACPDEQRSYWLARAAHALLAAEGQHEAAVWLLFEALLTEPREPSRLQALREHASTRRELTLLAHGLRGAIAARIEGDLSGEVQDEARPLLRELAGLAQTGLDNPHLALAAWQQLDRMGERGADIEAALSALGSAIEARRLELERAEQALARAAPDERPQLCRRVAALLPDVPEHWPRMIQLLHEALAGGEDVAAVRDWLETLYGLSRDAIAMATFLEDQAELCQDRGERARLLARLSAVHTVREDTFAVAAVCESSIALGPGSRMAIARLERAARRLGDTRRLGRALLLRASAARSARARGRALAQLARAEELAGMASDAVVHAVDALREDPGAADAALLVLRHVHCLDPEVARFALRVVAATCGPSRALFSAQALATRALADESGEHAALDAWVALLPSDAAAHRARMQLCAAASDAAGLLAASDVALYANADAEVIEAARAALAQLEQLEAWPEAAELALRICAEQGRADPDLAERAFAAARKGEAHALTARALELRVAIAPPEERPDLLFALADHHHRHGHAGAEVRALLRVLEPAPGDEVALKRLRALLEQAGDATRLASVIHMLIERERDPARRRELRLWLVALAGGPPSDPSRAEFQVRALVAESGGDLACVRTALGALVALGGHAWALPRCQAIAESCPPELGSRIYQWCAAGAELTLSDPKLALEIARRGALRWPAHAELLLVVERLTLAAEDTPSAMAVYDALIAAAVGPHGRRALIYRAGRWLERAGLLEEALARYLDAFALAPSMGAAFRAIQRVAGRTGQAGKVVPCYERLAEAARDGRTRAALLRAAAELCAGELGDRPRGLALLMQANAETERHDHDDRLLELAREIAAADVAAGMAAMQQLALELEERAGQLWNADDKARCLVRLASIRSDGQGQHEAALARLDEAQRVLEQEAAESDALAEVDAARALVRARMQPGSAATPVPAGAGSEPGERAAAEVPSALAELADMVADALDDQPPGAPSAELRSSVPVPAEPGAETPEDARRRLYRLIAAEPWRSDALRELHALSAAHGESGERCALRQLVSTFDDGVTGAKDVPFHSGLWRGAALRDGIGEALSAELAGFLGQLWECARVIPRLRRSLASYEVSERDRISRITIGPVAEAYAQAARMLGTTDVPVYLMRSGRAAARTLPTHPPAVLAGRGVGEDPAGLLYAMAHALWLAQPEFVIGGVLPQAEAGELIEATRLAFAPALAQKGPSAATKELAAALWQSVPTREQRALADVLRRENSQLEYAALRARIRASAARAALLCSGALGFALPFLVAAEPELAGTDIASDTGFAAAVRTSSALAETVRCALSEPFLTALRSAL
jgi:tetratricopeptide (TPR) repeat protein